MKFDVDACICTALQYWYMYTFRVQKKILVARAWRTRRTRGLWIDASAVRILLLLFFF